MAAERIRDEAMRNGDDAADAFVVDPGPDDAERVADLWSHIPSGENFYAKLYKKHPVPRDYTGRLLFLCDIEQPELVADMESRVLELAKVHGYGEGIYEVRLVQRGKPGFRGQQQITIALPTTPPTDPAAASVGPAGNGSQTALDALERAVRLVHSLTGGATAGGAPGASRVDPEAVVRAVTDAYRAGAESSAAKGGGTEQLAGIVKALKDLVPQAPSALDLVRELEALRGATSPSTPERRNGEGDFLDTLIRAKQAGLIPDAQPRGGADLNQMLEFTTAILPLVAQGDGAAKGALETILSVVGPQVGKIVGDITATINRAIDAKRERAGPPAAMPMSAGDEAPALPLPSPQAPDVPAPERAMPLFGSLPVFRAIQDAATRRDAAFYPQLRILLQRVTSPGQFEDIVAGRVALDAVLGEVATWGGRFFASSTARDYFTTYLAWEQQQRVAPATSSAAAPPGPSQPATTLVATCAPCGIEYADVPTDEVATATCEECGGPLTPVTGAAA